MADSYLRGNVFYLKLNLVGGVNGIVTCKTASDITFTSTPTSVRNQCTGDYDVKLPGGQKSGSISFSGDVNFSPTSPNISGFDLAQNMGGVYTAVWGGIVAGQRIVTVDVYISSVTLTSGDDPQISFTATLDFAGTPVFSLVTT